VFLPAKPVRARSLPASRRFVYELKHDGFRAIARVSNRRCDLISRRGKTFQPFASLRESLASIGKDVVLDGEIVVLDLPGRSRFYELLRRRGEPVFYAFDCLAADGTDLRLRPLLERKRLLRQIVKGHSRVLFAKHVSDGANLFRVICDQDLEGLVAKRRDGIYGEDWFKIRNPSYSQYEGRHELFEPRAR
jgi:bifunctional non-homologous end joining protein LigD